MNRLGDAFSASPAVAGGELFLRGEKHLYCIAEETLTPRPPLPAPAPRPGEGEKQL